MSHLSDKDDHKQSSDKVPLISSNKYADGPPRFTKQQIKLLDPESELLRNHKCVRTFGEKGENVTFDPSPHLRDQNGELIKTNAADEEEIANESAQARRRRRKQKLRNRHEEEEKTFKITDMDSALSFVAGAMQCDQVEATFTDQLPNNNKNNNNNKVNNILQSPFYFVNPFIQACEIAWAEHHPLKLEPSHIWLLILQALALHVDMHSQKLRSKWVKFDGKKKLVVRRDSFVKGLRGHNDWAGVIDEFSDQIDSNTVGDVLNTLEANFSNATKVDKIATKVAIMDICKNFFEYVVRTRCGFPQITITGTQEDWIKICEKTEKILKTRVDPEFGQQWGKALLPILKRFVSAFDEKEGIDCLFWNSMIKRGARRGSGGWEWYSGWINVFFPIISNNWNQFCEPYENTNDYIESGLRRAGKGNDVNKYPNGLASAPVKWEYHSLTFKLKFIAGFIGVKQDEDNNNELTPMIGWVIGEQRKENEQTLDDMQQQFKEKRDLIGSK